MENGALLRSLAHFVPWDELILHNQSLPQAPDVHDMNQQAAERARKEERSETIRRFAAVRTE
ncbi:hypothetical protein [Bacillus xiamenensis]|uniref:hypothetical protein n=1 Tax=Bacillus xiamenensis TaxID=1178537 RepID=UPI00028DAD15|nr:hypothetical protein [Bacillus xiamenensis]EKF34417.1 hypothetical protein BA1_15255 [Bacillus xiamenensis]MCW1837891.1 hypothetical protein [Bacillus xiamenensis]